MIASRKGNANERPDTSRLVGKYQLGDILYNAIPTHKTAMTNKQYLTTALSGMNISSDVVDIILLKGGLDPKAQADTRSCDLSTYQRMSIILSGAMQNVSEGGYSISWNMEAVKLYYNALCSELGVENVLFAKKPRIRNRSNRW